MVSCVRLNLSVQSNWKRIMVCREMQARPSSGAALPLLKLCAGSSFGIVRGNSGSMRRQSTQIFVLQITAMIIISTSTLSAIFQLLRLISSFRAQSLHYLFYSPARYRVIQNNRLPLPRSDEQPILRQRAKRCWLIARYRKVRRARDNRGRKRALLRFDHRLPCRSETPKLHGNAESPYTR